MKLLQLKLINIITKQDKDNNNDNNNNDEIINY